MFSGGLDSVALLANLLQETEQSLHAHHIEIQNYENRARAENDAVRRTLAYFNGHYRDFSYSSSKSEFPLAHLKKRDIYESIPRELADLAWSCRKPVHTAAGYEPCGRCHTCRSLAGFL